MKFTASVFVGVFLLIFNDVFANRNLRWLFKQHACELEVFTYLLFVAFSVHGCLERYMDNAKARFYTVKEDDLPMDLLMLTDKEKEGNDPYV